MMCMSSGPCLRGGDLLINVSIYIYKKRNDATTFSLNARSDFVQAAVENRVTQAHKCDMLMCEVLIIFERHRVLHNLCTGCCTRICIQDLSENVGVI